MHRTAPDSPARIAVRSLRRHLTLILIGVLALGIVPFFYRGEEWAIGQERERTTNRYRAHLRLESVLSELDRAREIGNVPAPTSRYVVIYQAELERFVPLMPNGHPLTDRVGRLARALAIRPLSEASVGRMLTEAKVLARQETTRVENELSHLVKDQESLQGGMLSTFYLAVLALVTLGAAPAIRRADDLLVAQAEDEAERAAMLVASGDYVVILGPDEKITMVNDSLASAMGGDKLEGGSLDAIFRIQGDVKAMRQWRAAQLMTPDGEIEVELRSRTLGSRGRIVVARDISRSNELEKQLESEESRRRAIIEAWPDSLFQFSRDDHVVWLHAPDSGEYDELTHGMIGEPLEKVIPPERLEVVREAFREARRTGDIQTYSYTTPATKDEEAHAFEARIVPTLNEELVVVVRDVTDRARADTVRAENEERMAEAERVGRFGSWSLENGGLRLSGGARSMVGIESTGYVPSKAEWLRRVAPEDRVKLREALEAIHEGGVFEIEYRFRSWRGEMLALSVVGRPSNRPNVFGWGTVADVTSARRLADGLREATRAALEASRMKSQFLANTSHEIRTPMHGILNLTHLIRRDGLTPRQEEFANRIESAADGLLGIIDDVLDLAKVEAGRLALNAAPVDLAKLVCSRADVLTPQAESKGLALHVVCDPDPHWCLADATRVGQIVTNLASNAIKFTHEGSVTLSARRVEGQVVIQVADTGVGIASSQQSAIFDSFVQADGDDDRVYGGTGLGLTIVRELVGLMEGTVDLESTPGQGSTFTVTLPLPECDPLPEEATTSFRANPFSKLRVLVAEDNLVNQIVAREVLENEGALVTVVGDGERAIQVARQQPFDIIFMDIQMPRVDGYEAARRIRDDQRIARMPRSIIIALTANAGDENRRRCLEAGMDDFAAKPLRPQDLISVLTRWTQPEPPTPMTFDPSPSSAGDGVRFDPKRLEDAFGGSEELMGTVLRQFVDTTRDHLVQLRESIRDADRFRFVAHTLKGASLTVGANLMGAYAREAEGAENATARMVIVDSLETEFEALRAEIAPLLI